MKHALATGLFLFSLVLAGCSGGTQSGSGGSNTPPPTMSAIQVSPVAKSIGVAATQQFTATAVMSNSTSKDVTSSVQWISSDSSIASIDASGVATGSV
jgi:uncharacterized protein YjdB